MIHLHDLKILHQLFKNIDISAKLYNSKELGSISIFCNGINSDDHLHQCMIWQFSFKHNFHILNGDHIPDEYKKMKSLSWSKHKTLNFDKIS